MPACEHRWEEVTDTYEACPLCGATRPIVNPRPHHADRFSGPRWQKKPTNMHSLRRTSAKGTKFVGTCILCGKKGLTTANMVDDCPNQRGLTQNEALIEAIEDDQ